jgi:drug/metabolite transporter (DMT)-like permease
MDTPVALNPRPIGHLFAFVTIAIWSAAFVSNKVLVVYLTPIEIMLYRFVLAYGLLWILYPRRLNRWNWREELLFFVLGALGIFVYFLFENFALKYTQATNVGLFMGAIPLLTALVSHFIHRDERFRPTLLVGFVIAMIGMGLILFEGHRFALRFRGDMLALLGALTFAFYSSLLKKAPARYHYIEITRKIFFYGLLLMIVYQMIFAEPLHLEALRRPAVWSNLLYLGIFSSGLAFVLYQQGIKRIGSVAASNYIYLIPLLTAAVGVLALGETVTPTMLLAGSLIVLGLYIAQKR